MVRGPTERQSIFGRQGRTPGEGNTAKVMRFGFSDDEIDEDYKVLVEHFEKNGFEDPGLGAARVQLSEMVNLARMMDADLASYQEQIERLQSEGDTNQEALQNNDELNASLRKQLVEKEAEILSLFRESRESRRIPSPSLAPQTTARRKVLPDPQPLTDGMDPRIDDWATAIRTIMKAYPELYHSEEIRMGYVRNLVRLPARNYIRAREQPDHPQPFETAEEILKVLERSLGKPKEQRKAEGRKECQRAYQRDRDFAAFWADFQRWAVELGKDDQTMLEDLRERLSPDLQQATVSEEFDTAKALADKCMILEPRLKQIQTERTRHQKKIERTKEPLLHARTITRTAVAGGSSSGQVVERKDQQSSVSQPGPTQQPTAWARRCYECGSTEHIRRNCPKRKREAKALQPVEDAEFLSANESADSGKE